MSAPLLVGRRIQPAILTPHRWVELGPMPGHASKPAPGRQAGSRRISALHAHTDTQVFIGYGDLQRNDGPTDLVSVNPATGGYTVHERGCATEAFEVFRTFGGVLYAPFIDPTGYWEPTLPYATVPPQDAGLVNMLHILDMAEFRGDLWLAGSRLATGDQAGPEIGVGVTARSRDGGLSWTYYEPSGITGPQARITAFEVRGERLLARETGQRNWEWDPDTEAWTRLYGDVYTAVNTWPDVWPPLEHPDAPRVSAHTTTSTHEVVGLEDGALWARPRLTLT